MSFTQTLFTIMGLVLLATFTLSLNGSILQDQVTLTQSEVMLEAIALAQKYIEQAESCQFDDDPAATIPSSFTMAGELGPESGEHYPFYDDIDDFNGYHNIETRAGHVPFTVNIEVDYVTLEDPDVPSTARTFFKRMTVSISSSSLSALPGNTLQMKKLFAYQSFYSD